MDEHKIREQIRIYKINRYNIIKDAYISQQSKDNLTSFIDGALYELNKILVGKYDYSI